MAMSMLTSSSPPSSEVSIQRPDCAGTPSTRATCVSRSILGEHRRASARCTGSTPEAGFARPRPSPRCCLRGRRTRPCFPRLEARHLALSLASGCRLASRRPRARQDGRGAAAGSATTGRSGTDHHSMGLCHGCAPRSTRRTRRTGKGAGLRLDLSRPAARSMSSASTDDRLYVRKGVFLVQLGRAGSRSVTAPSVARPADPALEAQNYAPPRVAVPNSGGASGACRSDRLARGFRGVLPRGQLVEDRGVGHHSHRRPSAGLTRAGAAGLLLSASLERDVGGGGDLEARAGTEGPVTEHITKLVV
jgi:hypothetical protein